MKLSAALGKFHLALTGARAPATLTWYRRRLDALAEFLGDPDLSAITIHDLRRWRAHVVTQTWRDWTKRGYVRATRRLFKWLTEESLLAANPALRLDLPRLVHEPKPGIDRCDMLKMLRAAKSDVRDYALLRFIADTACRACGAVHLRVRDLLLDKERAVVYEKGNKGRIVHMLPATVQALRAWLAERPHVDHDFVFTSRWRHAPLTYWGVYLVFKRRAQQASVMLRWNPHQWRHGASRAMLSDGASLAHVSQILGHASVDVTVRFYGSFADDELHQAHERFGWLKDDQVDS